VKLTRNAPSSGSPALHSTEAWWGRHLPVEPPSNPLRIKSQSCTEIVALVPHLTIYLYQKWGTDL